MPRKKKVHKKQQCARWWKIILQIMTLNKFEFEGGPYLRLRLKYDPPELYEEIGPAYRFLFENYEDEIDWINLLLSITKQKIF